MEEFQEKDVTDPFDLTLLPLNRVDGQELTALPGLLAVEPPRRKARGREQDRLLVYLSLVGSAAFSMSDSMQLTTLMAHEFYQTAGSLTSALRTTAKIANQFLLDANFRSSGQGQHTLGYLVLGVMRGSQLYLLQSGPTHVVHLHNGALTHYHDAQLAGRGLGFSQNFYTYLSMIELSNNDRLVLSAQMPAEWRAILKSERGQASLESMRRRLTTLTDPNLSAVLIITKTGSGKMDIVRAAREEPLSQPRGEYHPAPLRQVEPQQQEQAQPALARHPETPQAHMIGAQPASPPKPMHTEPTYEELNEDTSYAYQPHAPSLGERTDQGKRKIARALAGGIQRSRSGWHGLLHRLQNLMPRLVPDSDPDVQAPVSSSVMLMIALVVPLVIATIGISVYLNSGRPTQAQDYFLQAQALASQAKLETDSVVQRARWEEALYFATQAETLGAGASIQPLRAEIQAALDALDNIRRVRFEELTIDLPRNLSITRMAASNDELYVLDSQQGSLYRIFQTARGYEYDNTFRCSGPAMGIGQLVDLTALEFVNPFGASVAAIDAAGNLLYCAPGEEPLVFPLAKPSATLGSVIGFALTPNFLYVLDAQAKEVWIYTGERGEFSSFPRSFFEMPPQTLPTAIDIVVNNDTLYLLHENGYLTNCKYSRLDGVPIRCTESIVLTGNRFSQMILTFPPDTAIGLMDAGQQSLYRFSPNSLALQSQLRPDKSGATIIGSLTSIAISPNHVLYLAVHDKIYYSQGSP